MRSSGFVLFIAILLLNGCSDTVDENTALGATHSWIPDDRNLILTRAPEKPAAPVADLSVAVARAREQIELGQASGNERYYSRAEALMQPWWAEPPSTEFRVLKATILQRRHAFEPALTELSLALKADRGNAQAWLTSAMILQARGELDAAARHCRPLRALTSPLVALTCSVAVAAPSARTARATAMLAQLLELRPSEHSAVRRWAHGVVGRALAAQGQTDLAETHLRQALADGGTPAALIDLLDFLMDQDRLLEASRLVAEPGSVADHDGLLLRRAILARRLGQDTWPADLALLNQRQQLRERRGEGDIHLREQAWLALAVAGASEHGLELALKNWAVQREVRDARLVLEAALATGKPSAASTVLQWMDTQQVNHPVLLELAAQLGAAA